MADRDGDHHRIARQRFESDRAAGWDRWTDEASIQLSSPQSFDLGFGLGFLQLELDTRPFRAERRECPGEHRAEGRRLSEANAKASDLAARDLTGQDGRVLDMSEDQLRLGLKQSAGLGQGHAAADAREQLNAQFGFQCLDLLRQRWLRHPQALGGAVDVHLLGGDAEIAKMSQFHLISIKYQISQNNIFDTGLFRLQIGLLWSPRVVLPARKTHGPRSHRDIA
jgi:hypothetical protein